MIKVAITSALLLASAAAHAQGVGPGPGPGPIPDPWTVNGNSVAYPGCVLVPASVSGGCKGSGTMNLQGLYINGAALGPSSLGPISAGVLGYAGAGTGAVSSLTTLPSGLTIPSPIITGSLTVGTNTGFVTIETVNPTVYADPTPLTVYNPTFPYTSTVTYASLFGGAGPLAVGALASYGANALYGFAVDNAANQVLFSTGTTGIAVLYAPPFVVTSGSYNSGTGVVTLTTGTSTPLSSGQSIYFGGATGTGAFASLNGTWTTTAGTTGITVKFTVPASLTLTLTGGNVYVGNYAFGLFGQCFQFGPGSCVGAELNTWNEFADANGTFLNTTAGGDVGGFPNGNIEPNALQLVAYGGYVSKAAIGIGSGVNLNGTAKYGFQAGIYMGAGAAATDGIFVDANATFGPLFAGRFRTTGGNNTTIVGLQMMGAPGSNSLFEGFYDDVGTLVYGIDGGGSVVNAPSAAADAVFSAKALTGHNALHTAWIAGTEYSSFGAQPNNIAVIIDQVASAYVLDVNSSHNLTIGEGGSTTTTISGAAILSSSLTFSSLPSGTSATWGCFTSGAKVVSSASVCAAVPLTSGVSGILPIANGGSGTSSPGLVAGSNVSITGSWPNQTINASGSGGGATSCPLIDSYGGSGNGSTSNNTAFAAAVAASAYSSNVCVAFGSGNYYFASSVSETIASNGGLTLIGNGSGTTNISVATGTNLFNIAYTDYTSALHVSGMTLLAPQAGGGYKAFTLTAITPSTDPARNTQSTFTDVVFRGSDGFGVSNYWGQAISETAVSNILFSDIYFYGTSGNAGTGFYATGTTTGCAGSGGPCYSVVFNFNSANFRGLQYGMYLDTYVQGVTLEGGSNMVANTSGIYVPSSALGGGQLTVIGSQLGSSPITNLSANFVDIFVSNNNLVWGSPGEAGNPVNSQGSYTIVTDNVIQVCSTNISPSCPPPGTSTAVVLGSTSDYSVVSGNMIFGFATGVTVAGNFNNVQANVYPAVTTQVTNTGTSNSVGVATK